MSTSNDSDDEFTPKSKKKFQEKRKKYEENKTLYSEENLLKRIFLKDSDVEIFIKELSEATQQTYCRRDSQSKRSVKDTERREANCDLLYRYIKYCCIHGDVRPSTSTGSRKVYTSKLECPGEISFKLHESGKHYHICKIVKHSPHNILQNCQNLLVPNRKLSLNQKSMVEDALAMKASKLKLINTLFTENKTPVLRDISNIKYKLKQDSLKDSLTEVIKILKNNDVVYELKCDDESTFQALYFYTKDMKSTFQAWPEFIMIDSTYKLLHLEFPLVVLGIIDGNGATEIVGVCIVAHETEDIFTWFVGQLKKHNERACLKIQSCMSDKDLVARKVIKNEFKILVYICIWHVMQIFRRTITKEQMDVTKQQRKECLELLQKLIYSFSEEQYNNNYSDFVKSAPPSVLNYYNLNWHDIRHEWVKCYMKVSNFGTVTNNRIESLNQKLKLMFDKGNYLTDFIQEFITFLNVNKNERDLQIVRRISRNPSFNMTDVQQMYYDYLTPYAYEYVSEEIKKAERVHFRKEDSQLYTILSIDGCIKYKTSDNSCSCIDFASMKLPCRHIFRIRSEENLLLFEKKLCDSRWTLSYLKTHHRLFQTKFSLLQESLQETVDVQEPEPSSSAKKVSVPNIINNIEESYSSTHLVSQVDSDNKCLQESMEIKENVQFFSTKDVSEQQPIDIDETQKFLSTEGVSEQQPMDIKETVHLLSAKGVSEEQTMDVDETQQFFSTEAVSEQKIMEIEEPLQPLHAKGVSEQESMDIDESVHLLSAKAVSEQQIVDIEEPQSSAIVVDVKKVKLVAQVTKRGRPKGAQLNAIGLPKKRKVQFCKKFISMSNQEKAEIMLAWIVKNDVLKHKQIGRNVIGIEDLNHTEFFPCWFFNDEVEVCDVESFVSNAVYTLLCDFVKDNKLNVLWICEICKENLDKDRSIQCERCLIWMHFKCINLRKSPGPEVPFFCNNCLKQC